MVVEKPRISVATSVTFTNRPMDRHSTYISFPDYSWFLFSQMAACVQKVKKSVSLTKNSKKMPIGRTEQVRVTTFHSDIQIRSDHRTRWTRQRLYLVGSNMPSFTLTNHVAQCDRGGHPAPRQPCSCRDHAAANFDTAPRSRHRARPKPLIVSWGEPTRPRNRLRGSPSRLRRLYVSELGRNTEFRSGGAAFSNPDLSRAPAESPIRGSKGTETHSMTNSRLITLGSCDIATHWPDAEINIQRHT